MAVIGRSEREKQIEDAVYHLLENQGFAETTMRSIAAAAKASNETLYRWYGDKVGLYRTLIDRNAELVAESLSASRSSGKRGIAALGELTPIFLEMLLGDRYVALASAAVVDRSGVLQQTLDESGRKVAIPMIASLMAEAIEDGELGGGTGDAVPDIGELVECWATLAIGDLLALRMTGVMPAFSAEAARARSELALKRLQMLYPPRRHGSD